VQFSHTGLTKEKRSHKWHTTATAAFQKC